jgi:copper(I)-binding protein
MGEDGRVSGLRKLKQARARTLPAVLLAALVLTVGGCAGSTSEEPNTAGSASPVPGAVLSFGAATQGDIVVSDLTITRTGEQLAISAKIDNGDSAADELLTISSQVTSTLTFSPALTIPGKGSAQLGSGGAKAVLTENARLPTGGTVALTLTFKQAGSVQLYSQFS